MDTGILGRREREPTVTFPPSQLFPEENGGKKTERFRLVSGQATGWENERGEDGRESRESG